MSQKAEKPSLSGQRLKTRKRDEKEKYDPLAFRDSVIQSLNECGTDLDQVSKFLDSSKLDYRRYSDVLFDILLAGGILAPGGSIAENPDPTKPSRTSVCVFGCEEDTTSLKNFADVFHKLLRRYKYLEKSFEEGTKKTLVFLKGFKPDEQDKLATFLGIIFTHGLCRPHVLAGLFEDHLVKEGIALRFATVVFRSWLVERDFGSLAKALKASQLDSRLLELFPLNKRSQEAFVTHFKKEGLDAVANFQGKQQNSELKKRVQETLSEMISDEESPKDIVVYLHEQLQAHDINQADMVVHVWNTLMAQVEWNKKEELVAEQALKHLKKYAILLGEMAKKPEAELKLLIKIQDYCYENMVFMKIFQKIVVLLYKTDVLSEECILKWYNGMHSSKGKTVFLEQMKTFVEWLQNAEEESEDEED